MGLTTEHANTVTADEPCWDELVQPERGRVHQSVYTDPQIFGLELRRLFYENWFYVCHESQIAAPGDYRTLSIGQVPLIATRDQGSVIHVLVNRCAHRGTTVCQQRTGNARFLKCEYHGWVYDSAGRLVGVSLREGFQPEELADVPAGLDHLPRVEQYRGCVFASFSPDVPSLAEYLGPAAGYLDDWADQSPTGSVRLRKIGWQHQYRGNWKLALEGSNEAYHPDFLHAVTWKLQQRRREAAGLPGSIYRVAAQPATGVDLGHGHSVVELPHIAAAARERYPAAYVDELTSRLGRERSDRVLGAPWRMTLMPNVAFSGENVRIFRPITPELTEVEQLFVELPAVPPELNVYRAREERVFYGPAGHGGPDDLEMFERQQEGFRSGAVGTLNPWVLMNRQASAEHVRPDGSRTAHATSEIMQRGMYRGWLELMGRQPAIPARAQNSAGAQKSAGGQNGGVTP